jgi:hypothetical protein
MYLLFRCLQDRAPGPAHTPMSADEAEREQMMARMKAAGLGGQMYNRCGCYAFELCYICVTFVMRLSVSI